MKLEIHRVVSVALLAAAANAEGVVIVDAPGLGVLPDLATAIAAAAPGDVLIVAPGTYAPFVIDNKSLSIFALPGDVVSITGTIEVRNLGPSQRVVLSGLDATGASLPTRSAPGLRLDSNAGQVRVQRCTFRGGVGLIGSCTNNGEGGHGVEATNSARNVFSRCMIVGGRGYHNGGDGTYECIGGSGGDGIRASGSALALYDSTLIAGAGGDYSFSGGDGGHALFQFDFGVVAVNTRFEGGAGGDGWDYLYAEGGDGGDGLRLETSAQAQLLDNLLVPGPKGISSLFSPLYDGAPGSPFGGAGIVVQHPGAARTFKAPTIVSDRSLLDVTVEGDPGDLAWLLQSNTQTWLLPSPVIGVWLAGNPATVGLGGAPITLGASGLGTIVRRTGDVLAPDGGRIVYLQGLVASSNPALKLPSSPMAVLVLDRAGAPDCDGNAVLDILDLVEGSAGDCQWDLQLDSCQIAAGASGDCNNNGIPDECELASGALVDVNQNGIPDACEILPGGPDWYVDDSAAPGGNGSIGAPFETIWQAVLSAQTGHTIHVADGMYVGAGNQAIEFSGKNLTVRSVNGPANCVIDCQSQARAFWIHNGESDVRIEGFTIRNGVGLEGGAVKAWNASFTLRDCSIENCVATQGLGGGAVYSYGVGATIVDCAFRGNRCLHPSAVGGALQLTLVGNSPLSIRGSVFVDNESPNSGGALYMSGQSSAVRVIGCVFHRNRSLSSFGGAVHTVVFPTSAAPTPPRFENCRFAGNSGIGGGAIYSNGPSELSCCTIVGNDVTSLSSAAVHSFRPVTMSNCIVWDNTAPNGAQLTASSSLAVLTIQRSTVYNGQVGVTTTNGGVLSWGAGNLSLAPQFVDEYGPDNNPATPEDNDYRLLPSSPCVDSGDSSLVFADEFDLDGDGDVLEPTPYDLLGLARFYDTPSAPNTGAGTRGIVDMGCYEQQP